MVDDDRGGRSLLYQRLDDAEDARVFRGWYSHDPNEDGNRRIVIRTADDERLDFTEAEAEAWLDEQEQAAP